VKAWRYCPMCDGLVRGDECPKCGADTERVPKLTRQEQLEGLADRGIDTWAEFRGER
jgi:hypothetical protein